MFSSCQTKFQKKQMQLDDWVTDCPGISGYWCRMGIDCSTKRLKSFRFTENFRGTNNSKKSEIWYFQKHKGCFISFQIMERNCIWWEERFCLQFLTSGLSFFLWRVFLRLCAEFPVFWKMEEMPRGSWNSPDLMFPRMEVPISLKTKSINILFWKSWSEGDAASHCEVFRAKMCVTTCVMIPCISTL